MLVRVWVLNITWKLVRSHGSLSTPTSVKPVASHQNQTSDLERNGDLENYVKNRKPAPSICVFCWANAVSISNDQEGVPQCVRGSRILPFPGPLPPRPAVKTYSLWLVCSGLSREGLSEVASKPCPGPCSGPGSRCCPEVSWAGREAEEEPSPEPNSQLRVYIVQSHWAPAAAAAGGLRAGLLLESRDAIPKSRGSGFNSWVSISCPQLHSRRPGDFPIRAPLGHPRPYLRRQFRPPHPRPSRGAELSWLRQVSQFKVSQTALEDNKGDYSVISHEHIVRHFRDCFAGNPNLRLQLRLYIWDYILTFRCQRLGQYFNVSKQKFDLSSDDCSLIIVQVRPS